jgi:YggT family protein
MQYAQASIFLIKTLSNLYLLLFLLRIVLQWVGADFYNPLSQFVIRATDPLVAPLRKLIPRSRLIDLPTLVVLIVLEALATSLLLGIASFSVPPGVFAYFVVLRLIGLLLWLYIVGIFIYVILSWVSQGGYSPIARILYDIVNPVLSVVRRYVPPIGGLDLSALVVLILLQALALLLPLPALLA